MWTETKIRLPYSHHLLSLTFDSVRDRPQYGHATFLVEGSIFGASGYLAVSSRIEAMDARPSTELWEVVCLWKTRSESGMVGADSDTPAVDWRLWKGTICGFLIFRSVRADVTTVVLGLNSLRGWVVSLAKPVPRLIPSFS